MANKIHITSPHDLIGQEEGVFSVNGRKMKLFSYGQNQALFSVLIDGEYKKGSTALVSVDLKDIDKNSNIYKLGKMKS